MVSNKHVTKLIMVLMAIATVVCILAVLLSDKLVSIAGGTGVNVEYESELFDTSEIVSVDILMDEETWNEMLTNAMSEQYYACDVVVNGEKFYNVAIRPKGNTSLSAIAMDPDSDRYSLKLEFGHFVEGQTCFGLDKLILNNNYADATNMKEAIIYDMYQYLDADASLYNYATVSLNGEYQGIYLALEAVEQSFILRNYGTQDGEIYKPESMGMGGGNSNSDKQSSGGFPGGGFDFGNMPDMGGFQGGDFDFGNMPDMGGFSKGSSDSDKQPSGGFSGGGFDFGNMPDMSDFSGERPDMGGFGGFSMGGNGGANLNYTDDDLDSYSTIWDGAITDSGDKDHRRVVTALKNISEGNDLEKYMDIDNILKYMAVHTFAVNMDSLSGSMAHNYYLYEYDGKLNIIPWDYNLSFGGMSMGSSGDATEMVNDAIDTPFAGTEFFDALLENEEYLEIYHSYLQQLVDEYVNGGRFDEVYERIRSQIDSLVETDPTAFYSYDEYTVAADTLYETIKLRAKSIDGQLNGSIPSTDSEQRTDSSNFVDASHIDVKVMGQFSMGYKNDGDFKKRSDKEWRKSKNESSEESDEGFDFGNFPGGFDFGNMPDGFKPDNMPEGFDPGNMGGFTMNGTSSLSKLKTAGGYAACFVVILIVLIILKCFKRRRIK